MIGVGIFELGVGLILAALVLYFALRGLVSSWVLVLIVLVLAPILGLAIATLLAFALYALSGG